MTTARGSGHRIEREDVLLWVFAAIPVLAWIVAQQASYLAVRSICTSGHRWLLYLVMVPALAASAAAGAASWRKWKAHATYRRFMALGGVFLSAICAVSIFSLMIPAAFERLCD